MIAHARQILVVALAGWLNRQQQGLANAIIEPEAPIGQTDGEVQCRDRLGGLLRYYHRAA